MGAIQPWHIIVVLLVFLVLFGAKKLPDAARGLGRSMRIFKSEIKEMQGESTSDESTSDDGAQRSHSDESGADQKELPSADVSRTSPATPVSDDVKKSA